jgi:hypothetical protein
LWGREYEKGYERKLDVKEKGKRKDKKKSYFKGHSISKRGKINANKQCIVNIGLL